MSSSLTPAHRAFLSELASSSLNTPFTLSSASPDLTYPRTQTWNGRNKAVPLAMVEPSSEADVRSALLLAAKHDVPVSVISGGHDPYTRGLETGFLVLNLSKHFTKVSYDRGTLQVKMEGGALGNHVLDTLPQGISMSMAVIGTVGMVGWSTAGGYGLIAHLVGLGVDQIKAARVMLADGSVVATNAKENAELFWALRGGGPGFGVVLDLTIQAVRLPKMLYGPINIPVGKKESLVRAFETLQRLIDKYPRNLSGLIRIQTLPDAGPSVMFHPLFYPGDHGSQVAEQVIDEFTSIPSATVIRRGWIFYPEAVQFMTEKSIMTKGLNSYGSTRNISRWTRDAVDAIIESFTTGYRKGTLIIIHDSHGAACDDRNDTSFPLRTPHWVLGINSGWKEDLAPSDVKLNMKWADDLGDKIAKMKEGSLSGGYVNFLGPDDGERLNEFYGPEVDKLKEIKRRYDPQNTFRRVVGALGDLKPAESRHL